MQTRTCLTAAAHVRQIYMYYYIITYFTYLLIFVVFNQQDKSVFYNLDYRLDLNLLNKENVICFEVSASPLPPSWWSHTHPISPNLGAG